MKRFLGLAGVFLVTLSLAGCAPFASNITPSAISYMRYDGWSCDKLIYEQKFVEDSLTRASADQDSAATTDIWMVILIGVPTSGGGIKGEVARLKGEQIAIHNAMMQAGCIVEKTKPVESKPATVSSFDGKAEDKPSAWTGSFNDGVKPLIGSKR